MDSSSSTAEMSSFLRARGLRHRAVLADHHRCRSRAALNSVS
jgi:hypothetical protein